MMVFHVHGFVDERGAREVRVSQQEAETVIEVARGTIERALSEHTRIVNFQRTWPLDGYGHEWAVSEVNAITETSLDGGDTWSPMFHWFGTASTAWPLKNDQAV